MGAQLGGLGGSVNFTTLQPTLSWMSQVAASVGSNGKYNYSLAESGSLGKLGLAVQSVYRAVPSLVDGDYYLDASGLAYSHDGDSTYTGNLLKLRYEFGDSQTLSGTFLNSARSSDIVCLRQGAPPALPCGYGPINTDDSSVQLYALTDNALSGRLNCRRRSTLRPRPTISTKSTATSTSPPARSPSRACAPADSPSSPARTASRSTRPCRLSSGTRSRSKPTARRRKT